MPERTHFMQLTPVLMLKIQAIYYLNSDSLISQLKSAP